MENSRPQQWRWPEKWRQLKNEDDFKDDYYLKNKEDLNKNGITFLVVLLDLLDQI